MIISTLNFKPKCGLLKLAQQRMSLKPAILVKCLKNFKPKFGLEISNKTLLYLTIHLFYTKKGKIMKCHLCEQKSKTKALFSLDEVVVSSGELSNEAWEGGGALKRHEFILFSA